MPVTGHTGFKGSWLSLWLTCLGAKVYGFALEPPTAPHFELCHVVDHVDHAVGDIVTMMPSPGAWPRSAPTLFSILPPSRL